MSKLRELLKDIQKEKTLRLLLKDNYDNATEEHKSILINHVETQIDIDVDRMLNEFILQYQAGTPIAKKNRASMWVYIVGNLILTIGIGYAVNIQMWEFVWILGALSIGVQALPIIYRQE